MGTPGCVFYMFSRNGVKLGEAGDKAKRRELVMRALKAMQTSIDNQTIFEN